MAYDVIFVYDDRLAVSAEIEAIIGAKRYSDILHRRVSFGEAIQHQVAQTGVNFVHLTDDADARLLADLVEEDIRTHLYFRLPSCIVPRKGEKIAELIAQSVYAPQSALLAQVENREAPGLFFADDILPMLKPYTPERIHEILLNPKFADNVCTNVCEFVNLSTADAFLSYMWNATEMRSFNSASGDQHNLRKSSDDRDKMYGEYKFFQIIPENLKPFLVPTYDFIDDGERASYAMERLAIPDVALQYIHDAFDEKSFETLVDRFFNFIDARPRQPKGVAAVREAASRSILQKMDARLEQFLKTDIGARINALLEKSGPAGDLNQMAAIARKRIKRAIASDATDFLAVGHGDACFSNILFDRRTKMMRLIDPRGADSLEAAWMHPLYDVAKFSHSILGGYDFVNNDLFDCVVDRNLKLRLIVDKSHSNDGLQGVFLEGLRQRGYDIDVIRAYELSLFMSMLPLHLDHPRKLLGFTLIAAKLLAQQKDV